jgi:hypothetical protein
VNFAEEVRNASREGEEERWKLRKKIEERQTNFDLSLAPLLQPSCLFLLSSFFFTNFLLPPSSPRGANISETRMAPT